MNEQSADLPQIVLTPPEPVVAIEQQQVEKSGPVALSEPDRESLDRRVGDFVTDLLGAPVGSEAFQDRIDAIAQMGSRDIEASANVSSRLLQRPMAQNAGTSNVSKTLVDLRNTCEDLDPKNRQPLSANRLLGVLPFGNRIKSYFQRYEAAQSHINSIVQSLLAGKDELLRDNAAIDTERAEMWSLMGKLEAAIYLCKKIDEAISEKIGTLESSDPERARRLKDSVLFDARQKLTDLTTQMAVNVQAYMALDVIKRNNAELIKGIERARTTTLSALRTAVIVSSALGQQKLVLDRGTALQDTTGNLIQSTSEMLRTQGGEIFRQASNPTIAVDKLETAFQNVYATLNIIDDYKVKSLDSMSQTVDALAQQVDRAKAVLQRERSRDA